METNNRPKFCSQCGNSLPANAVFCPACGNKIGVNVPLDEPAPPREACATTGARIEPSPASADGQVVEAEQHVDEESSLSPFERWLSKRRKTENQGDVVVKPVGAASSDAFEEIDLSHEKNVVKMETVKAKFCSQCGNGLPPSATFCPNCGVRIEFASQASVSAPCADGGAPANNNDVLDNELKRGKSLDKSEDVAPRADQHISSPDNRPKKHFSVIGVITICLLGIFAVFFVNQASKGNEPPPPIATASRTGLLSDKVLIVKNLSSTEDLYVTIRFNDVRWTLGDKSIVIPANDKVSLGALELGGYKPTVGDRGVIKVRGYSKKYIFELNEDGPAYEWGY